MKKINQVDRLNCVLNKSWSFYKAIFLLLIVMLSACGASLKRSEIGFGKLVDYDCKPVAGARLQVRNTISNAYIFPGDSETMSVISDENGLFPFDVSTNAEYISLNILDGRTNSFSSARTFGKNVDPYNFRKEIKAITHSSKDSPIFIYQDRNGTPDTYTIRRKSFAISGQFKNRYKRQTLTNHVADFAYIRFGKEGTINLIILDALTGGDISTITNVTTRGFDIKDTVSTQSIEVNTKDLKKLFYIRSGKKNLAAIVSMTVTYISVSDSISIQYYIQRMPSVEISESKHLDVNLEECGGYMNRGVFGYYSRFTEEQKRRIEPLTKPQKSDPVKIILNDVEFINSQNQLNLLLNHKVLNDSVLEGLLEYDFISRDMVDNLYDFVRKNNWKRAVNRLAIDPRANESIIVDIINRLPAANPGLVKNLINYIDNYSSGSSVVVSAIGKFKEAERTNEERNKFISSVLQKGLLHSAFIGSFESDTKDLKIIHEFVMENSEQLLQEYNNKLSSFNLLGDSIYVPVPILEKVYFQAKNKNNSLGSLYNWASNPNTPLSVLTDMLNIPLAENPDIGINQGNFHKFIAALIDNPNGSKLLKKRLFRTLTDKNINQHFLNYYIKPGLAIARSTPESVFSQLVDDALNSKYGSGYSSKLLRNPMLPLALSERLVAKYGCLNNINETYARVHFKTIPDKSCYSAAVDSKITPDWVKRRILNNKYKVSEYSSNLEKEYIPPEQMKFLYCLHTESVKHKLLKNPYATENILVDIFNNHQQSIRISDLAENPATPAWILERIYRNDYSSRNNDREVEAKLLCNTMIPGSVKRYLKYQRHGSNCRKSLQTRVVLEDIKKREHITEPLNCAAYKKKKLELFKPEATILGYGEIIFKPTNESTYQIVNSAETIKAKKGTRFGVLFILKGDEYSRAFGNDVEIESVLTFQADGEIHTEESKNKTIQRLNRSSFLSYTFNEISDIEKGKWTFELRYRGTSLLKKTLITQ
jgi:hypothetical protein